MDDFELSVSSLPEPGPNQVLIKTLVLSIDPAMRGWVAESRNYVDPVPVGGVMRSFGVGEVITSNHDRYVPGDVVACLTGWQEWAVLDAADIQRKVDRDQGPLTTAVGVLGLTGLTAYAGIREVGRPKSGETVVVSTAAGSVGSAAGQIAKLAGARTIGLVGSDEKVELCRDEFGFDDCINYRTSADLSADLADVCPQGVDVYFDSVGGSMLDAVLDHITIGARIAICGTISQPATGVTTGPRVERRLLVQRAMMRGFLASDYFDRSAEISREMAGWVGEGKLKYREDVWTELSDAPQALESLLSGTNLGKVVVDLAATSAN